jgi:hypothetical protein
MTSEVISTHSVQRRAGEPPPIFDLPTTYSAALFPVRPLERLVMPQYLSFNHLVTWNRRT